MAIIGTPKISDILSESKAYLNSSPGQYHCPSLRENELNNIKINIAESTNIIASFLIILGSAIILLINL